MPQVLRACGPDVPLINEMESLMPSDLATPFQPFDPSMLSAWSGEVFGVDAFLEEMEKRGHSVQLDAVRAHLSDVLLKPAKASFRAPDRNTELGEISLEDAESVGGGIAYLAANVAVLTEAAAVAYVAVAAVAAAVAYVAAVVNAVTVTSG